jgi:hypothetical protein
MKEEDRRRFGAQNPQPTSFITLLANLAATAKARNGSLSPA